MKKTSYIVLLLVVCLCSCKVYKQDIMFQTDEGFVSSKIDQAVTQAEKNYIIQENDLLKIDLFTNKGERIIDPNFEFASGSNTNQNNIRRREYSYLVMEGGEVKLPILGHVHVQGLTLDEAEAKLEKAYDTYYKEAFVKLQFLNKRVVVLGASGGQVITLENENTTLPEILAAAGGVDMGAKAHNIRIIRGDYANPQVFLVDLSTVKGMQQSMIVMKPGDIVYIEPWRRVWLEGLKDIAPVLSLVSSVLTLSLVLQNL